MNDRKKRVLVVDDDAEICESVQAALIQRGYDVLVAHDGSEALMRIERDAPDLVVLDVVMPKRSGLTVVDRLHRSTIPSPRIILVTGNDGERQRQFARSRGVDLFMRKPFDMDELVGQVDSMLQAS